MKKLLLIYGHGAPESSVFNQALIEEAKKQDWITIHEIHHLNLDDPAIITQEQTRLTEYKKIVFQFPLWWYSLPGHFKSWVDQVLTPGFAYDEHGDKLKDREFMLNISVGSPKTLYAQNTIHNMQETEFVHPIAQIFIYCQMKFYSPLVWYDVSAVTPDMLFEIQTKYIRSLEGFVNSK